MRLRGAAFCTVQTPDLENTEYALIVEGSGGAAENNVITGGYAGEDATQSGYAQVQIAATATRTTFVGTRFEPGGVVDSGVDTQFVNCANAL